MSHKNSRQAGIWWVYAMAFDNKFAPEEASTSALTRVFLLDSKVACTVSEVASSLAEVARSVSEESIPVAKVVFSLAAAEVAISAAEALKFFNPSLLPGDKR